MTAYYNEHDHFAAAWLRELVARDLIATGDVDERDIREVQADELRGYDQVHLFAGIGGWSRALRLAGVADSDPVWTGSCPCQPFSVAGKGEEEDDPRHLWPEMRRLIAECRPSVVAGEQVASKAGLRWLAGVRADLEELGYAVGAADLPAACVGAPHKRQRIFWVADSLRTGRAERGAIAGDRQAAGGSGLGDRISDRREGIESGWPAAGTVVGACATGGVVNGHGQRLPQWPQRAGAPLAGGGLLHWSDTGGRVLACADGKQRRIPAESSLFPVAPGIPGRVGLLRGAGNAIVPQVAAEFLLAYLEAREGA